MSESPVEATLDHAVHALADRQARFALVGGLAVSIRAEVRFTRDVDLAVAVQSDAEAEALVRSLGSAGYRPAALVEHEDQHRLATIRLASPTGVVVDLLTASSGIEDIVVQRAGPVPFGAAGEVPVARPEELLALKVLSASDRRLQDRLDAINLILFNPHLDRAAVRANLALITQRGFARHQNLDAKLEEILAAAGG